MWARSGVMVSECPKSFVTAQSLAWLELHQLWRLERGRPLTDLPARQAEAFLLLEGELAKARNHDEGRDPE